MAAKRAPKNDQTPIGVKELISTHAAFHRIENGDLAEALGYDREKASIISMLKNGTMKLPMNKVAKAARALKIDGLTLLRGVDREGRFGIMEVIDEVFDGQLLTENEKSLMESLRTASEGLDFDINEFPEIKLQIEVLYSQAAKMAVEQLKATLRSETQKRARSAVESGLRRTEQAIKKAQEDSKKDSPDAPV